MIEIDEDGILAQIFCSLVYYCSPEDAICISDALYAHMIGLDE